MKNPLPLILTLAVGGLLLSRGKSRKNPVSTDDIPLSMDYDDPELKELLDHSDNPDSDEESDDDNEPNEDEDEDE